MGDRRLAGNKKWPGKVCMAELEKSSLASNGLFFLVYLESQATVYKLGFSHEEMTGVPSLVKVYQRCWTSPPEESVHSLLLTDRSNPDLLGTFVLVD